MPHTDPTARGRHADTPLELPADAWKDVVRRVKDQVREDQVPLLSAGVAFFLLLAMVPAFAALVAVYGLVADPAEVADQVENLAGALPESARQLLTEQLETVASDATGGMSLTAVAGIAFALWSASSGIAYLIAAVNAAYDERETRSFVQRRGLALALTVGAILFAATAIGVLGVLPAALAATGLDDASRVLVRIGSFAGIAVGYAAALAVLYRFAADRSDPKWRWVTPGAIVATVVWIVASLAFTFFVSNFGNYSETYGSIGAIIVLMLWLVITAFTVILGAEIDAELEAQTAVDTTRGPSEPLGERNAVKADRLGRSGGASVDGGTES